MKILFKAWRLGRGETPYDTMNRKPDFKKTIEVANENDADGPFLDFKNFVHEQSHDDDIHDICFGQIVNPDVDD